MYGASSCDLIRRACSPHFRHGQIHQHHLRAQRFRALDRFQAVAGAADDLQPVDLAEMAHRRVDEALVVIDQQDRELVHVQHPFQPTRASWGCLALSRRRSGPGRYPVVLGILRRFGGQCSPWRDSRPAMASSASGRPAGSASIRRRTMAFTAWPETLAPSRHGEEVLQLEGAARGLQELAGGDARDGGLMHADFLGHFLQGQRRHGLFARTRKAGWRSTITRAVRSRVS